MKYFAMTNYCPLDRVIKNIWTQVGEANKIKLYLLDDSLRSVKAFLRTGFQLTTARTTELTRFLFTFGLRRGFLDPDFGSGTFLSGPFGTLFFGSITLADRFTFLIINGFTINNIILNIMGVVAEKY